MPGSMASYLNLQAASVSSAHTPGVVSVTAIIPNKPVWWRSYAIYPSARDLQTEALQQSESERDDCDEIRTLWSCKRQQGGSKRKKKKKIIIKNVEKRDTGLKKKQETCWKSNNKQKLTWSRDSAEIHMSFCVTATNKPGAEAWKQAINPQERSRSGRLNDLARFPMRTRSSLSLSLSSSLSHPYFLTQNILVSFC